MLLFMGLDTAGFPDRVDAIGTDRPAIVTALESFTHDTRSYLVGITIFGAIVAVLDAIAVWILGVPLALLWALVTFVTNYIPNIGFTSGSCRPRCWPCSRAVRRSLCSSPPST